MCVKAAFFLEKYMRQSVLFNLDGGRGTFCRSVAARFAKNLSFCCDEGKKINTSTVPLPRTGNGRRRKNYGCRRRRRVPLGAEETMLSFDSCMAFANRYKNAKKYFCQNVGCKNWIYFLKKRKKRTGKLWEISHFL